MSCQTQIILVDNLKVRKMKLQIGDNIIGNDVNSVPEIESALEQAVKINLSDNGQMFITPYEGISCYMKNYGSLRWTLLNPNDSAPLRLRDTCWLYPIKIWFRVISAMDIINENSKRKIEDIVEDEPPDKKCCSEYNREVECLNDSNNSINKLDVIDDINKNENIVDTCENKNIVDVPDVLNSQLDQPTISVNTNNDHLEICNELNINEQNKENANTTPSIDIIENNDEVHDNPDQGVGDQLNNSNLNANQMTNNDNLTSANNGDNQATTVNTQIIPREKCKYGSRCYRLNAEHKAKFSHVGDADYDIPDDRPECPYGMSCYRINPLHKQHYKHTRNKRQAAINSVRNVSRDEDDSDESIQESVDESDYDLSFIDDDDIESLEEFESDFEDDN